MGPVAALPTSPSRALTRPGPPLPPEGGEGLCQSSAFTEDGIENAVEGPYGSGEQAAQRCDAGAVGEHGCFELSRVGTKVLLEQPLQSGAKIGGGPEIAVFV
jgi:hypothetical protein